MISLSREEIETLIDLPKAAVAIEHAYRATSSGHVNLPPVGHIAFPEIVADCHIKFGHLAGAETFVIKVATGFPLNADHNIPTGNGLVLVLSASTGQTIAVLHDEMFLTDVRTALGGAIASRTLARRDAKRLLVLGTGPQAQWQIKAHSVLLPNLNEIKIWGRSTRRVNKAIQNLWDKYDVQSAENLENAAGDADIIVTATGSNSPIILSNWIRPGTHITAVGADAPGKQELDINLVVRANQLVVDLRSQCIDHGEVSHAIRAKTIGPKDLVELGEVLEDPSKGRSSDTEITIADLTGIAAQDIAIANAVLAASIS